MMIPDEVLREIRWWRGYLPSFHWNESLRVFTLRLFDCSYCEVPVFTPKHFISLMRTNHRKWWCPKYCGIMVWI